MQSLQRFLFTAFLVIILFGATLLVSQDTGTCSTLVDEAVALTNLYCQKIGRNQACYGNLSLDAESRPQASNFVFEKPGDVVSVVDIASLKLDPLSLTRESWGVALLQLQADLPDTLPGQNVTMLLFGEVEVKNVGSAELIARLPVLAGGGVNVRGAPSTDAAIIGGLSAGKALTADGRLADSSWLRVNLPSGEIGWVFADLVKAQGDVSQLTVHPADDTTLDYGPMQAFYFRSGMGDTTCTDMLNSGLVIRTPEGASQVTFSINEVNIRLGSTILLRTTNEDRELVISTLEGKAEVEAQGVTQTVIAGERAVR